MLALTDLSFYFRFLCSCSRDVKTLGAIRLTVHYLLVLSQSVKILKITLKYPNARLHPTLSFSLNRSTQLLSC